MTARPRRRLLRASSPSRPARAATALLSAVLLCGALGIASAGETDASFADAEVASAQVAAATLRPPQVTSVPVCRVATLGGDVIQVKWKWPATGAPYDGLTAANTAWRIGASTEWRSAPTTGPDAGGTYTTSFDTALLNGLLGSLLGQSFTAQVRTQAGAHWASAGTTTVSYRANVLGILFPPTCSFANGA